MAERDEESSFAGTTNLDRHAEIPDDRHRQAVERSIDLGLEVVDASPPYDSGDITSLLACRSILDVLAVLVAEGEPGRRAR